MLQKVVFKLLKSFVKNKLFKKLNFKYSKEKNVLFRDLRVLPILIEIY